jgi:chitin synthase
LIQNKAFIANIPGGISVINALRWLLVGSMGIYILPIIIYLILFGKLHILLEILLGAFSLLFYGPTYLNILYMYSLCRIDDISWGTKGLDSDTSNANMKLTSSWKSLKYIHVSKFVVWNIIISVILLSFGASYTPRIFITIIIIAIMAFSQSIKVILGVFYLIKYKIKTKKCSK